MLSRSFAAFALGFALSLTACAESEEAAKYPSADPLVYEIANADGEVEGWMLGTIHALPDGVEWRTQTIDRLVANADYLWVEVAELDNQAEIALTFGELAGTRGLGPLSDRVAEDVREPLGTMIARSDFPAGDFADTESWAAAIMLSRVDAQGNPRNGVDRALIRDFAQREVRGFETTKGQLGVFDRLPEKDQRDLLEGTVREWVASREEPGKLMRAWISGDIAVLEEATTTGIMADPELREAILVGRNEDWIEPLEQSLKELDRPLVAVGTAHLIGPDGLAAMLEARGYTVTRLSN
ncbi:TraB/GumN family protein [Erythrobacter sp. KY5]|uniref:TraB/GumN family protein n=1 Tax=Erythrobacter sp. KY5 TaxID=2011159 RepID=UPI000DBF168D|nr:TraB/GumN family protein [Erythrobacter sp. KY5]AWW74708.1 TraB/GumN family protein [Erythrobacter sp. KY5]